MKFIIRLVINALFILISPLVFSGVVVAGFLGSPNKRSFFRYC